jgi:hypothetical protein
VGVLVPQARAEAPIVPLEAPKWAIGAVELRNVATTVATEHGLNVRHFLGTVGCESGWNTEAVGDSGTSFGLAQLHNPVSDWGITIEQAKNPYLALDIMAEAWVRGEETRWTCWVKKYGG